MKRIDELKMLIERNENYMTRLKKRNARLKDELRARTTKQEKVADAEVQVEQTA